MSFCFCNRICGEKEASEGEAPCVPALPAELPPAKLANPRSELPEQVTLLAQGVSRSHGAALDSIMNPPAPAVLRGLGHREVAANGDGEKTKLAISPVSEATIVVKTGTADTTVGEQSTDKPCSDQPGSSSNSFGNPVNRKASPEPTRCRAVESEVDKEDYAVAARRAEVRRLAHRMIQEELQHEQHEQHSSLPRSYKSKTMTTIDEDPSDGSATTETGGSGAAAPGSNGTTAPTTGPVAPSTHPTSPVLVGPKVAASPTIRSFSLVPGNVSVVHRGLLGFRRFRGANTTPPKGWKWTSFVAASTQRKSPGNGDTPTADVPALPAAEARDKENVSSLNTKGKEPAVDSHSSKPLTLANSDTKKETLNAKGKCRLFAPFGNDARLNQISVSESLSSINEDGSIHEAREALVVLKKNGEKHPQGSIDDDIVNFAAMKSRLIEASPRVSSFIHAASGDGTTEMRRPSAISGTSHISTLDLPPPLVDEPDFEGNHLVPPAEKDLETGRPLKAHTPFHLLSRRVTSHDASKSKKPKSVQATAGLPMSPAETPGSDAMVMQALKSRHRALLSEIGITLKKISRAPLDSRFRSPEDQKPEARAIDPLARAEEPVADEASAADEHPDTTATADTAGEQDQTSSALALEQLAEKWLEEIRQLHLESLESQPQHARGPGKTRKYQSYTWPPASRSTNSLFRGLFEDSPQATQLHDTLSLSNQPQGQRASAFAPSGRPQSAILSPTQLPESWWSMSVNTSEQDFHDSSTGDATKEERTAASPPDKSQVQNSEPRTATGPAVAAPTKLERMMKLGMMKFLSRRQASNVIPPASDETSAGAGLGHQEGGAPPKAQNDKNGQHGLNTPNSNANGLEDDANTIRVLSERASNQDRIAALAKSQGDGTIAGAGTNKAAVQLTAPSTPVKEAYREVHGYLTKSSVENRANRIARRISSFSTDGSFTDAVAHQSSGEERGKGEKEGHAKQLNDSSVGPTRTPWWMLKMTAPMP